MFYLNDINKFSSLIWQSDQAATILTNRTLQVRWVEARARCQDHRFFEIPFCQRDHYLADQRGDFSDFNSHSHLVYQSGSHICAIAPNDRFWPKSSGWSSFMVARTKSQRTSRQAGFDPKLPFDTFQQTDQLVSLVSSHQTCDQYRQ
jgi:hypothetical protein